MTGNYQTHQLGASLREMRAHRGLTQEQAAQLAGLTRHKVMEVESGKDTVSISAYTRLAAALGAALSTTSRTRPTLDELPTLGLDR